MRIFRGRLSPSGWQIVDCVSIQDLLICSRFNLERSWTPYVIFYFAPTAAFTFYGILPSAHTCTPSQLLFRLGAQLYPEAPSQVDAEDHPHPGDAAGRDARSPPQRLLPHLLLLLEHLLHHAHLLHGVAVDDLQHGEGHFHQDSLQTVAAGEEHAEQEAG